MLMIRSIVTIISVGLITMVAAAVSAQNYPIKPIRIIGAEVGGGTDQLTRWLAQGLSANLGQQVIVESRGGGVVIRAQIIMRAPPDGYTLQFSGASFWLLPFMQNDVPYDPIKDFTPVTLVATQPNVVVVHPSMPVKSVRELLDLAKAKPGALNYATGAPGAQSHLATELFKKMTGVNMVGIPYKGQGPALNGLMGGETHLTFSTLVQAIPHIKSGRLRALAVTSNGPASAFPSLPTVGVAVPGYEFGAKYAMFAPPRTPETIINRLNQEIVRVLHSAEIKEMFSRAGAESVGSSPKELVTTVQLEMTRLGKVIQDAGVRAD